MHNFESAEDRATAAEQARRTAAITHEINKSCYVKRLTIRIIAPGTDKRRHFVAPPGQQFGLAKVLEMLENTGKELIAENPGATFRYVRVDRFQFNLIVTPRHVVTVDK